MAPAPASAIRLRLSSSLDSGEDDGTSGLDSFKPI